MFLSLIHLFYQPVYCVNLRLTAYISNLLYFDYTILDLSGEYQSNCYSRGGGGHSLSGNDESSEEGQILLSSDLYIPAS